MPTQKAEQLAWLHPSRLPLGGGWSGHCCAPGHVGVVPADEELRDYCNLGYASACSRLPHDRAVDAIRFSIAHDYDSQLSLWFVCEAGHRPASHGKLKYDVARAQWTAPHPDTRIQKMAECYVESYLLRRMQSSSTSASPER